MCNCCCSNQYDEFANNNKLDLKHCREKFHKHLPHEWFEVQGYETFWVMDEKVTQSVGTLYYCNGYLETYA